MTSLTDFQDVVAMALDLSPDQAIKVRESWPGSRAELRRSLNQWNRRIGMPIKGVKLLASVNEIWSQKPDDLETAEGRKIFYHPINGQPIPKGSPLDGLRWEILAFLRWANKEGLLPWADEVSIIREVKAANANIDALPDDRFYAKNSMPRDPSGGIDWSDVALAQAKKFVLEGNGAQLEPIPDQPMFYDYDGNTLEGLLASIPALRSQDARNMLLRGMPGGPAGAIPRNSAYGPDLANIVRSVEGWGRLTSGRYAINVLIDNAAGFVKGTAREAELNKFKV